MRAINIRPGLTSVLFIGGLLHGAFVSQALAFDFDGLLKRLEPVRITREKLREDVSGGREAFLGLVSRAEGGDADAQYQLGLCLRDGCHDYLGIRLPPVLTGEAAWWFTQAVKSGHVPARVELVRTKVPEELYHYHMADGKQVETRTDVQTLTHEEKLEILKPALEAGYRKALSEIERVEREWASDLRHEQAFREREETLAALEEQFAETGDPDFLYQIGQIHIKGFVYAHEGNERSVMSRQEGPAFEYIERAAGLGHGPAILLLGSFYEHGVGVEENWDTALNLYLLAEEKGTPGAAARIAYVERKIQVPIERKKRMAFLMGLLAAGAVALSESSGSSAGNETAGQSEADGIRKHTDDTINTIMHLDLYKHSAF